MMTIFLDFETYFDTKFSLTKMTTMEYIRDPRFKVWGMGYRFIDETETTWLGEDEVADFIQSVDWDETAVVAHNAMFDAYILTQYYNVDPSITTILLPWPAAVGLGNQHAWLT